MHNIDSRNHTRGESIYVDDLPTIQGTLFAAVFDARVAHAHIKMLDISKAQVAEGVFSVLTANDITGENQIGGIVADEPLLADGEVHFCGMPIAVVLAESQEKANHALKLIRVEYETHKPVIDPREAAEKGLLIIPPRTFEIGSVEDAWTHCHHIFEGRADSNGQEHLYIETQGCYSIPMENGKIRIISSTQGPTAVQRCVAKVLGVGMHQVEVDVTRLGGGFGGKEDQANAWAAIAALGTKLTGRPVKFVLDRMADMRMTGKRHPYSSDYKIGFDKNLKIIAFKATFYQNAGAAADLSPAVLERTLFHCTNAYSIPNVWARAYSCKTNLPPNTAFRGFGGPQGMFVIESAIAHAAEKLGIRKEEIQKNNLLSEGNQFPYGQIAKGVEALHSWEEAENQYNYESWKKGVESFNKENTLVKKGLSIMPICFGISFTKTLMNQARALVHVYSDGSIAVSTGAVEMGQGVNTKMLQVAAHAFSVSPNRIRIESTNTGRIANTSPTAASATADLNGKATWIACQGILNRMKEKAAQEFQCLPEDVQLKDEWVFVKDEKSKWDWKTLVMNCFVSRINLSEHGHYATPDIHFDLTKEKGHPFAYHVYGTSIFEVTVDCLRGTYEFEKVAVVHDYGKSMNPIVDKGQIEGGLVQGMGWMTLEEVIYNNEGRLISNALSTYKVPDIYSVPKILEILPLDTPGAELAIFKSKAVGEPPLMYGIGAYFAIRDAVKAFRPEADIPFDAPFTPEKVLMALYDAQPQTQFG